MSNGALLSPSVGIIGAGVSGLSVANELIQRGLTDITVIDAEYVASGSSGLSVGMIETQYLTRLEIELRALSMARFDEHAQAGDLQIVRNGYLRVAHTIDAIPAFHESVEIQRSLGLDSRVLDPEEILALVPHINSDDLTVGLWGCNDGYIDGHLYATSLAERIQERGARLHVKTEVLNRTAGTARNHRLETSNGTFEFDVLVNAAGAWAQEVGARLGTVVRLRPQRHQVVSVHLPFELEYMMPSLVEYVPGSGPEGLSIRHESYSHLLATLHSEETLAPDADPHDWHTGIDDTFIESVSEHLLHRLPGLVDSRLGRGWAGLYPTSPDGQLQAGPFPEDDTIFAALGVGGFGIQVAPAVGTLVAEWIVDGAPSCVSGYERLLPGRASLQSRDDSVPTPGSPT
jgi:sarcosine oxidase subunit beta